MSKRGRPITHDCGTQAAWGRGCRCDKCTTANRQYHRLQRIKRKSRISTSEFRHGLSGYVNWLCRCLICSTAHKKRMSNYASIRKAKEGAHQ